MNHNTKKNNYSWIIISCQVSSVVDLGTKKQQIIQYLYKDKIFQLNYFPNRY